MNGEVSDNVRQKNTSSKLVPKVITPKKLIDMIRILGISTSSDKNEQEQLYLGDDDFLIQFLTRFTS